MISFLIPIRTRSETNLREPWQARHKRRKHQRLWGYIYTNQVKPKHIVYPIAVHLTRLGPQKMDSDNLPSSMKAIRDGIADAFEVNDGDETMVTWTYAQEKSKEYGVRVKIT